MNKALKRFVRVVHPDLFARCDESVRRQNERSLQQLLRFVDNGRNRLRAERPRRARLNLKFFIAHENALHSFECTLNEWKVDESLRTMFQRACSIYNDSEKFISVTEQDQDDEHDDDFDLQMSLPEFLEQSADDALELARCRAKWDQSLSLLRYELMGRAGIRSHVMRSREFDASYASFQSDAELARQRVLFERLLAIDFNDAWRDVVVCLERDGDGDGDGDGVDVDALGRVRLREFDDDEQWRARLARVDLATVRERQQEVVELREHERALAAALGCRSIQLDRPAASLDDYYALLERLAEASLLAKASGGGGGGDCVLPVDVQVVDGRDGDGEDGDDAPSFAIGSLQVPLDCSAQRFDELLSARAQLYAQRRDELVQEDDTLRLVRRSTRLRALSKHSGVSSAHMIRACIGLRGLFNAIGPAPFHNQRLTFAHRYDVREDGTLIVPYNYRS
jgi:Domain of unknown function (DUF4461)/Domain of unknown function (DUF4460)